jgi:hypothetical protein
MRSLGFSVNEKAPAPHALMPNQPRRVAGRTAAAVSLSADWPTAPAYRAAEAVETGAILTTAANERPRPIHEEMPVIARRPTSRLGSAGAARRRTCRPRCARTRPRREKRCQAGATSAVRGTRGRGAWRCDRAGMQAPDNAREPCASAGTYEPCAGRRACPTPSWPGGRACPSAPCAIGRTTEASPAWPPAGGRRGRWGAGGAAGRGSERPGCGHVGTRAAEAGPDRETQALPALTRPRQPSRLGPMRHARHKSALPFCCWHLTSQMQESTNISQAFRLVCNALRVTMEQPAPAKKGNRNGHRQDT